MKENKNEKPIPRRIPRWGKTMNLEQHIGREAVTTPEFFKDFGREEEGIISDVDKQHQLVQFNGEWINFYWASPKNAYSILSSFLCRSKSKLKKLDIKSKIIFEIFRIASVIEWGLFLGEKKAYRAGFSYGGPTIWRKREHLQNIDREIFKDYIKDFFKGKIVPGPAIYSKRKGGFNLDSTALGIYSRWKRAF